MTVGELVEVLQKFSKDKTVYLWNHDTWQPELLDGFVWNQDDSSVVLDTPLEVAIATE